MQPKNQWLMFSTIVDRFQASRLVYEQNLSTPKQKLYGTFIANAFAIKSQRPNQFLWNEILNQDQVWQDYQNQVNFYLSFDGILIVQINQKAFVINEGAGLNVYHFPDHYDLDLLSATKTFFKKYPNLVRIDPTKFAIEKITTWKPTNPQAPMFRTNGVSFHFKNIKAKDLSKYIIRYFDKTNVMICQDFITITNVKKPPKWTKPTWIKNLKSHQDTPFDLIIELNEDGKIIAYVLDVSQTGFQNQWEVLVDLNNEHLKSADLNQPLIFKTKNPIINCWLDLLYHNQLKQPVLINKVQTFSWTTQFVTITNEIKSHFANLLTKNNLSL